MLKCETIEDQEIWSNAIIILKNFLTEKKNSSEMEDSDIMTRSIGKKEWKMKNVNQETLKGIISEKESNSF